MAIVKYAILNQIDPYPGLLQTLIQFEENLTATLLISISSSIRQEV